MKTGIKIIKAGDKIARSSAAKIVAARLGMISCEIDLLRWTMGSALTASAREWLETKTGEFATLSGQFDAEAMRVEREEGSDG